MELYTSIMFRLLVVFRCKMTKIVSPPKYLLTSLTFLWPPLAVLLVLCVTRHNNITSLPGCTPETILVRLRQWKPLLSFHRDNNHSEGIQASVSSSDQHTATLQKKKSHFTKSGSVLLFGSSSVKLVHQFIVKYFPFRSKWIGRASSGSSPPPHAHTHTHTHTSVLL